MLITISAARITPAVWAGMSIEDKAEVVRKARAANKELPAAVRAWENAAKTPKSSPLPKLSDLYRYSDNFSEEVNARARKSALAELDKIKKENESIKKEQVARRKLVIEYNKVMELAEPKVPSNYTPAKALKDGKLLRSHIGTKLMETDKQGKPDTSMASFEKYKNSKQWYFNKLSYAEILARRSKGPHKDHLMQVLSTLANADMELQRQFMLGYYKG